MKTETQARPEAVAFMDAAMEAERHGLSPHEYRLFCIFAIDTLRHGSNQDGVVALKNRSRMSLGMIVKTRDALERRGLIRVSRGPRRMRHNIVANGVKPTTY